MPAGEKRYVWRCQNRLENGRRICKNSPTLEEPYLHAAIVSAMNEMFQMRNAKQTLMDSITTALAVSKDGMTLPAVESQIRALQERQMELFQLAVSAGADCDDYDEEIQRVNAAKTYLMAKKAELELRGHTATEFDRRVESIEEKLEHTNAALTDFDEITVRQLISSIKVLDKERLLILFKDGTEIEQYISNGKAVCAS